MKKYLPLIALSSSLALSQTAFAKSSGQFLVGAHGGVSVSSTLTNASAGKGTTFNQDINNFHSYVIGGLIGYRMQDLAVTLDFTYLPIADDDGFTAQVNGKTHKPNDSSRFEALFLNVSYEASWLHPTYHPFVSIGLGNLNGYLRTELKTSKDLSYPAEAKTSDSHLGFQGKLGVNTDIMDNLSIGINYTYLQGFDKYRINYADGDSSEKNRKMTSGDYSSHSLVGQVVYAF